MGGGCIAAVGGGGVLKPPGGGGGGGGLGLALGADGCPGGGGGGGGFILPDKGAVGRGGWRPRVSRALKSIVPALVRKTGSARCSMASSTSSDLGAGILRTNCESMAVRASCSFWEARRFSISRIVASRDCSSRDCCSSVDCSVWAPEQICCVMVARASLRYSLMRASVSCLDAPGVTYVTAHQSAIATRFGLRLQVGEQVGGGSRRKDGALRKQRDHKRSMHTDCQPALPRALVAPQSAFRASPREPVPLLPLWAASLPPRCRV